MSRTCWFTAVAAVALAGPAAADGITLPLELLGTLAESRHPTTGKPQFTLAVDGEGVWVLVLDAGSAEAARDFVGAKVFVAGVVGVRTTGNVMVTDRRVVVNQLVKARPAVRVVAIVPGSPAAAKLEIDDLILEVDDKAVTGQTALVQYLGTRRGEAVKMMVSRGNRLIGVDGLTVQRTGRPLGYDGADAWLHGGVPSAPIVPGPTPEPRKDT